MPVKIKFKSNNKKIKENMLFDTYKPFISGCIFGFIIFIAGLLISSFIIYKYDIDTAFIYVIPLIFLFIGAFICGIKVQKKVGGRGFLTGILSAVPLSVITLLFIMILLKFNVKPCVFITTSICIAGGFVGGITAVNTRI